MAKKRRQVVTVKAARPPRNPYAKVLGLGPTAHLDHGTRLQRLDRAPQGLEADEQLAQLIVIRRRPQVVRTQVDERAVHLLDTGGELIGHVRHSATGVRQFWWRQNASTGW